MSFTKLAPSKHSESFFPFMNVHILENSTLEVAQTVNAPRAAATVSHSATHSDLLKTLCRTEQAAAITTVKKDVNCSFLGAPKTGLRSDSNGSNATGSSNF